MKAKRLGCLVVAAAILGGVSSMRAAPLGTGFTYQGQLKEGGAPLEGKADFEFSLWDEAGSGDPPTGGTQLGISQAIDNQMVIAGLFTVTLNAGGEFERNAFIGGDRWLQIAVRSPAGGGGFTTLAPRQPVTSTPYAFRSLNSTSADTSDNATRLGGLVASQYVLTTDSRMTDGRNPLPDSINYIQNTLALQNGDFNIDGDGTAGGTLSGNAINSTTQYNIGGSRVLTTSSFFGNIFAGIGAGMSNGLGSSNSFFGNQAGQLNETGGNNSFFGKLAGNSNTASNNSFFGESSGFGTTTGGNNSFYGQFSGRNNQTGSDNAFFGFRAGQNNSASGNSFFGSGAGDSVTSGQYNAFFGKSAGAAVNTGFGNSFFGDNAGLSNTANQNSFFGRRAGVANTTGEFNSFFGYATGDSNTTASRNSHFGSNAGSTNTDGDNNSFFGYNAGRLTNPTSVTNGFSNSFFGASAGDANTTGKENAFFGANTGGQNSTGGFNVFVGEGAGAANTTGNQNTALGWGANVGSGNLSFATAIGAGAVVNNSQSVVLGRSSDAVRIPGSAIISSGLDVSGGAEIAGLIRLPGLANSGDHLCILADNTVVRCFSSASHLETHNDKQEVEQRTLVEAQGKQITEQQKQLQQQQRQIDALKRIVCLSHPQAEICREEE